MHKKTFAWLNLRQMIGSYQISMGALSWEQGNIYKSEVDLRWEVERADGWICCSKR